MKQKEIKSNIEMISEKKKNLLREFVDFCCEQCKYHQDEVGLLQPHRIRRGNEGGTYEHRNIKMLCDGCHKKYHQGEFNHVSG